MSYETLAPITQVTSLIWFIAMFLGVVAYAIWPGNSKRFERAQAHALELEDDKTGSGKGTAR